MRQMSHPPPRVISAQVRAAAFELARRNLLLAAEALKLERLFAAANLPMAFLKGTSLAALAYGDRGIRHSKDIDLLVDPEIALAAFRLLETAGYQRCNLRDASDDRLKAWMIEAHHLTYVHRDTSAQLEVHWRLFRNRHLDPGLETIDPRSISADQADARLDDFLLYLCIHGADHKWFRLKWLADVAALLAQAPEARRYSLYYSAEARGAGPYVGQALLLCHRLLGLSLSPEFLITLRSNRLLSRLERVALDKVIGDAYEGEPETWRLRARLTSTAQKLFLPGWKYRITELGMLFNSLEDFEQFPVPRSLGFLYPLLRLPLWLHRKCRERLTQLRTG
jgi:hypothetical protein